ncbi:MAG: hypothetical protein BWY91_01119 [bacterium ADurb.BinA028]|nr:MAG: hypothetical protein BWY91_01119 [bacterium ADurb.BinA028]
MSAGAVEYETVSVPPFLAPATSGAGPLAVGSIAAAALESAVCDAVAPVVAPGVDAGAEQAAVRPKDATAPTART